MRIRGGRVPRRDQLNIHTEVIVKGDIPLLTESKERLGMTHMGVYEL